MNKDTDMSATPKSNLMQRLKGLATSAFARNKEKKVITVPSQYDDALVLYNDANVDSMLATAMMFFIDQFKFVRAKAWHYLDFKIDTNGIKTIVVMGHELDKDLVHTLIVSTDVHLVLPMREGSWVWLEDSKLYQAHKERFTLMKAEYEDVSTLHKLTDNTFCRLVEYFVYQRSFTSALPPELAEALPYVMRYTTFAYPIAEFTVNVGEVYPVETENRFRILIRDLTSRLMFALDTSDQRTALMGLRVQPAEDQNIQQNYTSWHQRVTTQIGRSISDQNLVVEKGETKTWRLRLVSLAEPEIHQLGLVPLHKSDAIVAYEDIRGFRFYRIYAPNVNDGKAIAEALKPHEYYVEGVFVVAITKVPQVLH